MLNKKEKKTTNIIHQKKDYDDLDYTAKMKLYDVGSTIRSDEEMDEKVPAHLQSNVYNIYNLRDELMRRGYDIAQEIYNILTSPETPKHEKRKFIRVLLPYTFERLTDINIKAEVNNNVNQVIQVLYENTEIDNDYTPDLGDEILNLLDDE
jgi:hypothetical protein